MIYYEQLGANISNSNSGPVYMVNCDNLLI